MPDPEGKQKGPGTTSPDQAYKEGREEDIQEGSLGADPDRDDMPLSEGEDKSGSYQTGGFTGDEGPSGTAGSAEGTGDAPATTTEPVDGSGADGNRSGDNTPPDTGDEGLGSKTGGLDTPENRQDHPRSES